MNGERLSYRFGPLERRGLLGPLRFGQVVTIGSSLAVGVELLDRIGGGEVCCPRSRCLWSAVGVATAPVAGRTIEEWAPVGCAFALGSVRGRRRFRSRLPIDGATLGGRKPPLELPASLRGVELVTVEHNGRALGALSERRGRLLTPVLACQALSFALLDPEVQERRLAAWGTVLATAANAPVRRLQWIERTTPAQGDELARWLHTARDPALPARGAPVVESYLELIGQSTQVTHDHEILLAVQLDTGTPAWARAILTSEQVIEQVGQIVRGLESAEIRVLGALTTGQLLARAAHGLRSLLPRRPRRDRCRKWAASTSSEEHAAGPMARRRAGTTTAVTAPCTPPTGSALGRGSMCRRCSWMHSSRTRGRRTVAVTSNPYRRNARRARSRPRSRATGPIANCDAGSANPRPRASARRRRLRPAAKLS